MIQSFFQGVFATDMTADVNVADFFFCAACSLVIGLILAFGYMYRSRYTKSFIVTLALLPTVVCVVIMVVNGNVGSMFRLTYNLTLKDPATEKEMIDQLRCRNGNL